MEKEELSSQEEACVANVEGKEASVCGEEQKEIIHDVDMVEDVAEKEECEAADAVENEPTKDGKADVIDIVEDAPTQVGEEADVVDVVENEAPQVEEVKEAEEVEVEEVELGEPDLEGAVKFYIGWEAAAFLLENDSERAKFIEKLAGVDIRVKEDGQLQYAPSPGSDPQEIDMDKIGYCIKVMCALHDGSDAEIPVLPPADSEDKFMTVLDVPEECVKAFVRGKGANRLRDIFTETGAITGFVVQSAPPEPEEKGGSADAGEWGGWGEAKEEEEDENVRKKRRYEEKGERRKL